jgi:hypothetical protein
MVKNSVPRKLQSHKEYFTIRIPRNISTVHCATQNTVFSKFRKLYINNALEFWVSV